MSAETNKNKKPQAAAASAASAKAAAVKAEPVKAAAKPVPAGLPKTEGEKNKTDAPKSAPPTVKRSYCIPKFAQSPFAPKGKFSMAQVGSVLFTLSQRFSRDREGLKTALSELIEKI